MAIVRGEPSALMALSASPEVMEIVTKGHMIHEDYRFDFAVSGSTVAETWPAWAAAIGK